MGGFWSRLLNSLLEFRREPAAAGRSGPPRRSGTRPRVSRSGSPLHRLAGIESLEPRLDVCSLWWNSLSGDLLLGSDYSGESVSIGRDSVGDLLVDGQTVAGPGSSPAAASAVQAIGFTAVGLFGLIDLSGVNTTSFNGLTAINYDVGDGPNAINIWQGVGASINTSSGATVYISYGGGIPITYQVGSGSNALYASSGDYDNVVLDGGPGTNALYAAWGSYTLNGGAGSGTNTLYDGGGTNTLNGGSGTDILDGSGQTWGSGGGFNTLNGGSGSETLYGGGGTNILNDGGGTNLFVGGSGSNYLNSPSGISIANSGSGYNLTNNASGPIALGVNTDVSGTVTLTSTSGNNTFVGASGPITAGNANHLSVTKTGAGSQILSGTNVYDGATTISAGMLTLDSTATLGNTAISVAGGATFAADAGSGPIYAGTMDSGTFGATLALNTGSTFSMADGAAGAFNLQQQTQFAARSLSINNATLDFDLGSSGADLLATSGSASVSGTNTINITALGSSLTAGGSYPVISAASGLTGNFVFSNNATIENLVVGGHYYTLELNNTDAAETLTVQSGKVDFWVGTSANRNWNTSSTDWSSAPGGSASTAFGNGDIVVFGDGPSGMSYNVAITAPVSPNAILFDNSSAHAYTISGSSSNVIGGSGTLALLGSGSATLVGQNTFTGVTTIAAGATLQLGNSTGNGSVGGAVTDNGVLSFANPSPQTFSGAISGTGSVSTTTGDGALTLSGVSTYSGATTIVTNSALQGGAPNAFSPNSFYAVAGTLDVNGFGQSIGSLSGSGAVTNSAASTTATLTVGNDGSSTEFTGLLQNGGAGGGILALAMGGPGALTLTHTNTFSGGTTITDGTLALGDDGAGIENVNSLGSGAVTVSGGQLRLGGASGSVIVSYSIPNAITLNGGSIFANDGAQHLMGLLSVTGGGTLTTHFGNKDIYLDGGMTGSGPLAVDDQ
jgi:fibronectin-binding autotransporter adhesin